ncbi:hypothetical protein PHYBLDRAFT_173733 [Phycomyces blakesleeanus NRRL 1555(-)]|uniref:Uncharacterized protein n=1 Tax=Phycomyces blakesleeanus (strain ATCC 8743b / DSM 1359 / FGSC 10004 / NBRC 33097 / NRRL 1555) TaxID=763407 RepID=A0A167KDA9_PHYB8|nr:hypothetical protein PHYBLDRAFT_173733 [Phycomyces blakesleeanus NRRL 1555(-)]OAD67817.1 hypothetical protein PHYBLDRAFT_173733 [Phycomyces blakesleeanus NRRL 1555(-)]|eukprot:XP_018285857.1 hypothetical protein PHYBLDRAFT_173733 [Phycomyces blakesleeanus NRRL 1555(-)]
MVLKVTNLSESLTVQVFGISKEMVLETEPIVLLYSKAHPTVILDTFKLFEMVDYEEEVQCSWLEGREEEVHNINLRKKEKTVHLFYSRQRKILEQDYKLCIDIAEIFKLLGYILLLVIINAISRGLDWKVSYTLTFAIIDLYAYRLSKKIQESQITNLGRGLSLYCVL